MADIYIYAPDAEDFDSLGLVGALTPTLCTHEEIAGGMSEIALEHPLDGRGRFRAIKPGYILKAPIPVRTTPEINGTQIVTSVEKWTVSATATKAQRYTYTKASGGKKKKLLPLNYAVLVTNRGTDRYKVKTSKYGTGWISKDALTGMVQQTIPATPAGIEQAMPAWSVQPQLFRIVSVDQTDTGVKASARHISYDLLGNMCNYVADNPTANEALQGALGTCAQPHDFSAYTDVADRRVDVDYRRANPIKALLDPETGVASRWGLEMVRDDYELYLLSSAGVDRGVRVEYAKNLLGINCTTDMDSVATAILPVGESKAGKPVFLASNQATVSESITPASFVNSANISDYPTPRILVLDVPDAKIDSKKGGAQVTPAVAAARMREAANRVYEDGGQYPSVTLTVDWLRLGDTEEYKQFAQLDNAYLYDPVTVIHQPQGIKAKLKVVRIKYDCLTGKYLETELGALENMLVGSTLTTWQIPQGMSGGKIAFGSMDGSQFQDDIIDTRMLQAESVTADKVNANLVTAGWFQAGVAEIAVLTVENADIDWAHINTLVAEIATIVNAAVGSITIDTAQIKDLAVTYAKIADEAVDTSKIKNLSVDFAKIAEAAVHEINIQNESVTRSKIADLAVDTAKIALGAITTALIEQGAVGTLQIKDSSITDAKIVELTANKINAGTLSVERLIVVGGTQSIVYTINEANGTAQLSQATIDGGALTERTITADRIVAGAITAKEIAAATIIANNIAAGAITTEQLAAFSVDASKIKAGSITTNEVASNFGEQLNISSNVSITSKVSNSTYQTDKAALQAADVATGANAPANPSVGKLWCDTGSTPAQLKEWDGTAWQIVTDASKVSSSAIASGAIATLDCPIEGLPLDVSVALVASQSGTGDPSPSNVRTISGVSSVKVTQCGRNLLPNEMPQTITTTGVTGTRNADGSVTLVGTATQDTPFIMFGGWTQNSKWITLDPAKTYVLPAPSANTYWYARSVKTNPQYNKGSSPGQALTVTGQSALTFVGLYVKSGTTINETAYPIMVESGESTAYAPYDGNTYSIPLPEKIAGMSGYEPIINATSGLVTLNSRLSELNGTETIVREAVNTNTIVFAIVPTQWETQPTENRPSRSSHFVRSYSAADNEHMFTIAAGYRVYISKSRLSSPDVTGFKAWLAAQASAGSPVQIEYAPASPPTVTVTPATVPAIPGLNNIYSDAGTTTASYRMSELQNQIDATNAALGEAFTEITQTATAVTTKVSTSDLERYMRFGADGLTLGMVGSPYQVVITNERMSFLQSGQEIAYMSSNKLYITQGEVRQSLRVGNYLISASEDGGMLFSV